MKGILAFIFIVLFSIISLGQNKTIDILHYDISLKVTDNNDSVFIQENILLVKKEPIDTLWLDLYKNENIGMTVHQVSFQQKDIPFLQKDHKIYIPISTIKQDTIKLYFSFSGIPKTGLIIQKNKFGHRTFFGDNWPNRARHWFICNDHLSDKATVDFSVIAPAHYEVISNGIKTKEILLNSSFKQTNYKCKYILPTKVMVVGIADFKIKNVEKEAIPTSFWVYPENATQAFDDLSVAPEILSFFTELVAPYPFHKLAHVQSTTEFGGMENAGCIFYGENEFTGEKQMEMLIAHETAHQWFGNCATESDWKHLWLSEGFATYFTHLYAEKKYGKELLQKRLLKDRKRIQYFQKMYKAPVIDHNDHLMQLLNPNSYQRGSWVLHMLRQEIGDSLFFQGIRKYFHIFQYKNASSKDFFDIMESVSGQDFTTFYHQWLTNAEIPIISTTIKQKCFRKKASIILMQKQKGKPFRLKLETMIHLKNGTKEKINTHFDGLESTIKIPVNFKKKEIVSIQLDPEVKVLFFEK